MDIVVVTGFGAGSQFSLPIGEWCKNVVVFGVDNTSSTHTDYKKSNPNLW